jgi:hypothetical protein
MVLWVCLVDILHVESTSVVYLSRTHNVTHLLYSKVEASFCSQIYHDASICMYQLKVTFSVSLLIETSLAKDLSSNDNV